MSLISFNGVTYHYPGAEAPALSAVTAQVEPGEVILVRGPSGSGKSTLLRCLNGLVPHSTGGRFVGHVIVDGLDTRDHPPRAFGTRVGFVFQHPDAQFVLEDVEAELAFGLENLGLPRPLMRKRIEEVLDQVGIAALRHRRIATLSGGERQRVAIAAALTMHPQVIALDEPTSQLDPQAAEDVLQVIARLVAELGMTTLIAEHRVERVAPMVDRVWTLNRGSLEDLAPRAALAGGGARPPVVDLALRSGWDPLPLGLREARPYAAGLAKRQAPNPAPTADGPTLLRADRVTCAYGGREAVRDVSLLLRRGEITVLMGRNGSGKTTLLKLFAGLLKPGRGRVATAAAVAYVPQDADTLLFAPTVREELRGVDAGSARPFADWLDRYPRDLSSGERQQLAVAIAADRAEVLLLDEPTRGLDPAIKEALSAFLRTRAAAGASVLTATHDVEWAARTAGRILLMADGEIYADGPPRIVLADSLVFSTQVNKLLGGGWLLPDEVPV
ncbi:MAG: ATP-binding cassette domain-containing protein [Candidatus Dormibacteraeota bacterium]|nr:ATP-binding cassette domain-containing protein [Candidatus Dormibacteraeota bacterium]